MTALPVRPGMARARIKPSLVASIGFAPFMRRSQTRYAGPTLKLWFTLVARYVVLPTCEAVIVQVPVVTPVTVLPLLPLTVHTPGAALVKVTGARL